MLGIKCAKHATRNVRYTDAVSGRCGNLAKLADEDVK